ncbi:MAG: Na+/H+ antiporter subunit E [Bauldia litoralis]
MLRAISLFCVLFATWLLLSGHTDPLLIGFGVASCALVVFIARRMDIVDREGHPVHLTWRVPLFWAWLGWQILKSSWDVARRCVLPGPPIDPRVIRVPVNQKTDLGVVTYANAITLTPGTVSMRTFRAEIEVHALTGGSADDLESGEMNRFVARVEGHK